MICARLRRLLLSQRAFGIAVLLVVGWPLVLAVLEAPVGSWWSLPQAVGAAYVLARLLYGVALVLRTGIASFRTGYADGRE